MLRNKGFSLVEIGAIGAIVAILAVIAVPSYKNYLISSRMTAMMSGLEGLLRKSIDFASVNGRFASAVELVDNPAITGTNGEGVTLNLNPTLLSWSADDISNDFGESSKCGKAGQVSFFLNGEIIGLGDTSTATINCLLATKNGSVHTKCFYTYSTVATSLLTIYSLSYAQSAASGNILPGATNAASNLGALATDFFADANCMD